jgi:hypothetical protein
MPLCGEWMVVHGPDSKRDGRALSALLGDPPEVSRYLRSDSVVTADDGAKESAACSHISHLGQVDRPVPVGAEHAQRGPHPLSLTSNLSWAKIGA